MKLHPKVTLVGAGPGDPDLLTIKGIKALQSADAVLYDALVNKVLLAHVPAHAQKVFVGKRRGFKAYSQDEINDMLVNYAITLGHVVRLKGGDPFVFGRGYEEMAYVKSFGIETTSVPGISSAIAVPENAGIPLTHRTVSSSFWVVSGTAFDSRLTNDLRLAIQSSATVVVLMGMAKLALIVSILEALGKSELPVAIIQNGTTSEEKIIVGTVKNIAERAAEANLGTPSIIVLGETVRLRKELSGIRVELQELLIA
ncbi:MAG: uroporphyrinogen-III C-methyltransferase [Flavobacteriales bacterium CG_4_9_14_3_um_filter_40_17]|nr:MAG: uroporphyrinogen-III C-methyltransferase [Flavobacteriales bacterium CG_4_9_14_3_um_filter_40_17]